VASCNSCSRRNLVCAWPSANSDYDSPGKAYRAHSSDEGEDDGRWKRAKTVTFSNSFNTSKLACPYFQRNPLKYQKGACAGSGYDAVHRLKLVPSDREKRADPLTPPREHLYRTHKLPVRCQRCFSEFKSEDLLSEHLRSLNLCTVLKTDPSEFEEGFDKKQEEQLRSRKGNRPSQTEEDKWKDVYRILFPNEDVSKMPSPCMLYPKF
jgi:hypothetical protein